MYKFNWLSPLLDADGEIGAASEESTSVESTETAAVQTPETVTEDVSKTPSFAKRLSEERSKIEKEFTERYKDYDTHKQLSGYLSELNGGIDILTLKEQVEMEQLERRAETNSATPEMQRRLEDLEAKANEGEKLKQDQQENQRVITYFSAMEKFLEGKGAKAEELNQFMVDNKLQYDTENMEKSFDIAYKAMKSEEFEKKANEKESDTIKRYLASKTGPRVEGSTGAAAAQTVDTSKMSWDQIDRHAAERVRAMNTPQ